MKKRFLTTIISIIAVLSFAFGLMACSDNQGGEGRVPVYQGMSISNGVTGFELPQPFSATLFSAKTSGNTENNGNHNGWHKGDYEGKEDDIDQENPFPENESNENIEEEIKSSLEIVGSGKEVYYANPNEDIYIFIHISNPDNYEIMSFTLNGKKYSSYMFENGSDMETLILKYNVGANSGIQEYTIDAIKYIDGTEIKDVIMDGDKTVLAGIKVDNQVTASLNNVIIQTNTLSFDVEIKDDDNLISYSQGCLKAVVYDGENVVATKDLTVGDNNVSFDNLSTSTLYQCAIVGYYDDLSGEGFAMNTLYKEAFYTKAIVLFDNIIVSQESVQFDFLWDSEFQDKTLTALKLYKGNTLTELSATATAVNNLLSNTIYTLIAEYKTGEKTENISLEFKTQAKETPTLEIVNPVATQTSVGFAINETDADNVGAVTKIEFIHANGTVVADSIDVREFTGLLSDNTYTVKVTYAYDLNDGVGVQEIVKALDITTQAKAVPVVEIASPTKTQTSISAEYTFTDIDNVGNINSVKIYKGETLIAENTDKEIVFTNLEYYTEYKIVIAYSYDLNDGDGVHNQVFEITCKTNPHLVFNSCKIINTSAVSEGETIFMQATLDNPSGALPSSVVVNGQVYNCAGSTTANKIYIEIVNNGQFEGGNTTLFIEEINMTLDGATYTLKTDSNNSDNVFINGKLEVLKIEYVNEDFEPIDWAFPSDIVYVMVTLDNPTGYEIDYITSYVPEGEVKFTELLKIDNNHWAFTTPVYSGWNHSSFKDIKYHNDYINKVLEYSEIYTNVYCVLSNETKYVTDVEDLKNMNEGYYYELTKDIDLSGLEWNGAELNGVFEGNGYSIKNMSFIGTIKNSDARLGLFSYGSGVIQNLNIKEATVIVELLSKDEISYNIYAGAFVADSSNLNILNCSVDEFSIFNTKNYYGYNYTAGFIGNQFGNVIIRDSINKSNITALSNGVSSVGGFVGQVGSAVFDVTIINSTNIGDISATANTGYAGGLIGDANNMFVCDSTNKGNVSVIASDCYIGGLAGGYSIFTITNFINCGTLKANDVIVYGLLCYQDTYHCGENSYDLSVFEDYDGTTHTYTFVSNGGNVIDSITTNNAITLPTPIKEGYYFGGWFDNSEFNGTSYTSVYYSSTNTTLYAKWLTEEEYSNL